MAGLDSLRELYAWMREAKVSYAKCGELELRVEPLPAPRVAQHAPEATPTAEDEERQALADVLYSSVDDAGVEAILAMRRKDPS